MRRWWVGWKVRVAVVFIEASFHTTFSTSMGALANELSATHMAFHATRSGPAPRHNCENKPTACRIKLLDLFEFGAAIT